ncbi:MAG: hypothetical protein JWO47_845 [Candidatus Saccharibacteria bacterium]|nr:hypothetical protein [Candidatus Saccharibacteria bacterium]
MGYVVILAVVGVACYFVMHALRSHNKAIAQNTCVTDKTGMALSKDITLLKAKNVSKLKPIATQIESLKGYQKSPTCMYVLTMYYINASDAIKAQAEYDTLKELKPHGSYGINIQKATLSLTDLKTLIEGVKLRSEQFKNNVLYGPVVPK